MPAPDSTQRPQADTATTTAPPASAAEPAPAPIKLRVEDGKPPYRLLPGSTTTYRRYVGRLGARPVVMEICMGSEYADQREPQLFGRCYDARSGKTMAFSHPDFNLRRPLRLQLYSETDSAEHWQMRQPLGPWLTGTVTTAGQPARRFTLREDYRGAVPLAIRSATMYGRPVVAELGDRGTPGQFTGSYYRKYVQLLGSAAQRPELQRALPSRPAQVRAQLRQAFEEGEAGICNIEDYGFGLDLNDYDILSYSKAVSDFMAGSAHPLNLFESFSCDLRTGRRITLASLLRPGREPALRRLALRYMNSRYRTDIEEWNNDPQAPAELLESVDLEESFGLTPEGLLLDANIGPHVMGSTTIIISYAALRPLLRPRTPLNRVLVARGLAPVQ
ncbi:RsiV family protein [Hymenobacter ruricola]|uniref:DUF3298 domain-containing protein n=1 Tax=Hymenobacter ruricola TaxID=2791023 RepID=A0ABS0I1I7_9BACT|nr:RsiV family protein [Hymenobacter ruricola]MBF9220811.1 hypothetical protein [Hymenobacter ruricola]